MRSKTLKNQKVYLTLQANMILSKVKQIKIKYSFGVFGLSLIGRNQFL
jgi:hypothetical protein